MTTQTIKVLMIAQKNKHNADGKVPIFARITVGMTCDKIDASHKILLNF